MKRCRFLLTISILLSALSTFANEVRIVSLSPALTEIVCFLGAEKNLVGRTAACDYPASVKSLPATGKFGTPQIERIIALKPTLVIGNDLMNMNIVRKLRELGITVELKQIDSMSDYIFWVDFLAEKLSLQAAAAQEKARIQAQLASLQQLPPLNRQLLWVINARPIMAAGSGSLPDEVIKLVKAENAAAAVNKAYFRCSPEWLLQSDPDIIIYAVPGTPDRRRGVWKYLKAVKNDRVIKNISRSPVMRPGPRFLDAVIKLRKDLEKL